jgi:hypothetical protein
VIGETKMSQGRDRRDFLWTALNTAGLLTLAGCGGGGGGSQTPAPPAPLATASVVPTAGTSLLVPITASTIAAIRERPERFLDAYAAVGGSTPSADYLRSKLGQAFTTLTDAGCMAAFASMVAFSCAAQGDPVVAPMTATLGQLLSSPALTCGHFCKLATLLSLLGHPELIPPDADAGDPPKATLHFMVWIADVPLGTGLHSQLVLANLLQDAYVLLDPMYAFALRIPYVGAGPQADLTVIENAAVMLQSPISLDNLTMFNPAASAALPQLLPATTGGALGPQYILHDALYGAEGWDARIAQIFSAMGTLVLPVSGS